MNKLKVKTISKGREEGSLKTKFVVLFWYINVEPGTLSELIYPCKRSVVTTSPPPNSRIGTEYIQTSVLI